MNVFSIDAEQQTRLASWLKEQYARVVAEQKKNPEIAQHIFTGEDGVEYPYLGAIGGGLTYSFTPTGLGVVTTATFCKGHPEWEATIDLTDYENW